MKRFATLSRPIRLVLLIALLATGLGLRTGPTLAQGEISTVIPSPELPGVPGDIPVAGFTTLTLGGGNYQWQTTSRTTGAEDDDPIEVHNGFLLSIDQSLIVLKPGAPSRPVPAGNSLPLNEGDRVKPVASGDTPGKIVLVEFVAEEDLRPDEQPDQTLPVTLDPGTYTIALLDITNLGEDGPTPGQVIVQAAGPGFAISSTDDPDTGNIPLVIWLASIFRTGDAVEEPGTQASPVAEDDNEDAPPAEPDLTPSPTEESDDADEPEGSPVSSGTGDLPRAAPTESSTPGSAAGTTAAPVLPGVPADIPVLAHTVLEFPEGDFQWQTRSITSLTRTDDPIDVHDGFLIAVDQPVIVLRAGAPSQPVAAGQSLVLKHGDRILPTSTGDTPANIVIVELVAIADIDADEAPDEVLPLTLESGTYTLAMLDISGVGADGPSPGEIIAEAAGPGFGISADEETGAAEPGTVELTWLVGIFPATDGDLVNHGSGEGGGTGGGDQDGSGPGTGQGEEDGSGGGNGDGSGGGNGDGSGGGNASPTATP